MSAIAVAAPPLAGLRRAAEAVTVGDGPALIAAGRVSRLDQKRGQIVQQLATALYAGWYTGWLDSSGAPHAGLDDPWVVAAAGQEPLPPGSSRDLTAALRAAHAGSQRFTRGWRAERVSSTGRVLAERGGRRRLLGSADYVAPRRPGLPPRVGDALAAVDRRDSLQAAPGFWLAMGEEWPEDGELPPLVRTYWNVSAEHAPSLVETLTEALEAAPPTWALKLPVDAALHVRRDAAVLYLPRAAFAAFAAALGNAADRIAGALIDDPPPLTLRLAPGVGAAEDPPGGESFGSHRCRLVAEAIATAAGAGAGAGAGAPAVEHTLNLIVAHLRRAGIDPEQPHLDPGSRSRYRLAPGKATGHHRTPRVTADGAAHPSTGHPGITRGLRLHYRHAISGSDGSRFRDAGLAIARELAAAAIWHEDRCTWMGDSIEPTGDRWTVVTRSCTGDLYGGTAGIGWFLAQAAACGDESEAARAARGAVRHAMAAVRRPPAATSSLLQGPLGAAWAALETGALLGDPELRDAGAELAGEAGAAIAAGYPDPPLAPVPDPAGVAAGRPRGAVEHDLLAGEAGAILGLLAVERRLGDDARGAGLAAAAHRAADRLLAGGRSTGFGRHWPAVEAGPYGLCGLAHGASGMALALLALHARTGDQRHHEAARAALAYERRWFRADGAGWPDLREATAADLAAGRHLSYPALWCHGAVGIGLVRLAAYGWDRRTADLAELGAAIQCARASAAQALRALDARPEEPGAAANWSLCHGLMGTAELMLCAAEALGAPAHRQAARRLGELALSDRALHGTWRCGVPGGGETPGLMLGLAGIGSTLLRLGDPASAPSPALAGVAAW